MKIGLTRLNGVRRVTERVLRPNVRAGYIRAIEWRSTTLDTTVLGHSNTYQLAWLVATRIGLDSLLIK
jgi:hypothetical protein